MRLDESLETVTETECDNSELQRVRETLTTQKQSKTQKGIIGKIRSIIFCKADEQ